METDEEKEEKLEAIRQKHIDSLHAIIRTQSEYIIKLERDLRLGRKLFESRTPKD
jgi:hypothetical protein